MVCTATKLGESIYDETAHPVGCIPKPDFLPLIFPAYTATMQYELAKKTGLIINTMWRM
jgi:hypothetical protein